MNKQQSQSWEETDFSDPLNTFDNGEKRTPMLIVSGGDNMPKVGQPIGWYQNGQGELFAGEAFKTVQTNSNASGRGMQMVAQPITAAFCPEEGSKTHSIGWAEELSPTLRGGAIPATLKAARETMNECFTEKRFFYWVEDNTSVSLRAKSGSYGGGVRNIDY